MERSSFCLLLAVFQMTLLGCAAARVSQDYLDPAAFGGLHSYGWVSEVQEKTGDLRVDNPLLDRRIRAAVEHSLDDRGFSKNPPPDFRVGYELAIRERLEAYDTGPEFGFGWWGFGRNTAFGVGAGTEIRTVAEAVLVISVFDAAGTTTSWRGTGTWYVRQHPRPEETNRIIEDLVGKILAQFPPR